jgi:hypothetical protein
MRRRGAFLVALSFFAHGCGAGSHEVADAGDDTATGNAAADAGGSPGAGVYDCAWVRSANCWKSAVASAVGCLPPAGSKGVYSSDGATCTYPGGIVITFTPAMMLSEMSNFSDYSLTKNGAPCVQFARTNGDNTLTTPGGTVAFSGHVDGGIVTDVAITCPDHTTYSGPTAPLASCAGELPGFDDGLGGTTMGDAAFVGTFYDYLAGADSDGGLVTVFACQTP